MFCAKLCEDKGRAKDKNAANKSLDVRAKQRLSFHVVFLTRSCVDSVSPHVNSVVRWFPLLQKFGNIRSKNKVNLGGKEFVHA